MHKNIGYHTRSMEDGKKLVGGSFGGAIDQETVERISRLFTVIIKPSGRAVFVDDKGNEVCLYFYIDPQNTEKGKQAIKEDRQKRELKQKEEQELLEQQERELTEAMQGLSHEEILEKLAK